MKDARLLIVALILLLVAFVPGRASFEPRYRLANSEQATLSEPVGPLLETRSVYYRYSPRTGIDYEVRVPEALETRISFIVNQLMAAHISLERTLGKIALLDVRIELLNGDAFVRRTGAPEWVSAMYYDDQILIPLPSKTSLSDDALAKTIRHEYTHAALDVLTDGNCPGWLEEGLAQQLEGGDSAALQDVFFRWVRTNGPLDMKLLQGGFTKLSTAEVPVAYGQSLFMTGLLLKKNPKHQLRHFLNELRANADTGQAFASSFGVPLSDLEEETKVTLARLLTL